MRKNDPVMPNPVMPVHWLKLSRGCTNGNPLQFMVFRLQGAHRLGESLTQVDDRRWSLQKVCGNLVRVAGSKIIMLTKSDDRMDTDTSSDIQLVFSLR